MPFLMTAIYFYELTYNFKFNVIWIKTLIFYQQLVKICKATLITLICADILTMIIK